MVYKFSSRATADMIMLDPDAKMLLTVIGKDPSATGIVTVAQIPGAIATLKAAIADEDNRSKAPTTPANEKDAEDEDGDDGDDVAATVGLKQRAVPFLEMLERSAAEGADVVWGV